MPNYIRPKISGATVFFTVAVAERRGTILTDHITVLREAVRRTREDRPFRIDAWVVLPDHLHAVWTLPAGDCEFSTRWSLIKARFSRAVPLGSRRSSHRARRERGIWPAVLGASPSRATGLRGGGRLLSYEPGQARVVDRSAGLAVFVGASRAPDGSRRHVGCAFTAHRCLVGRSGAQ